MLLSSAAEDGTKCCYQMAKPEDIDEAGLQVSRCFRLSPLLHSLCTAPCRALCRGHSEVAACSDRCCFFRLLIIRTRRSSRGPRSSTWQSLRLGPRSSCARGYSSSCGDPPPVVAKCKGEGEGEGEGKGERVSIGDCVIKKTKTETAMTTGRCRHRHMQSSMCSSESRCWLAATSSGPAPPPSTATESRKSPSVGMPDSTCASCSGTHWAGTQRLQRAGREGPRHQRDVFYPVFQLFGRAARQAPAEPRTFSSSSTLSRAGSTGRTGFTSAVSATPTFFRFTFRKSSARRDLCASFRSRGERGFSPPPPPPPLLSPRDSMLLALVASPPAASFFRWSSVNWMVLPFGPHSAGTPTESVSPP